MIGDVCSLDESGDMTRCGRELEEVTVTDDDDQVTCGICLDNVPCPGCGQKYSRGSRYHRRCGELG